MWPGAGAPSRRVAGVLAAGVLAVGIVAGAALGPAPSSSPADASTLAQRAIAALVTRANGSSPASAPASSTPALESEATTTPTSAPIHKTKAASEVAPTPASSESSSPGESSSNTLSSEGSSSEGSSKRSKAAPGTPIKLPQVKHVWVITLSGTSFSAALASPATDPYLAKQLVPKGTLLSNYTLSASSALGNGIAWLSGQSVNLDTEQNCPTYTELQPPTVSATNGLAEGVGCVYPAAVKTLADELTAGALTWKAYVQDMDEAPPASGGGAGSASQGGAGSASGASSNTSGTPGATTPTAGASSGAGTTPTSESPSDTETTPPSSSSTTTPGAGQTQAPATQTLATQTPATQAPATQILATQTPASGVTCRRPELSAADPNHAPEPGDPYLTFRNPFVYFDSLLDEGACASNDVDLTSLQSDLATSANTPSLSWIVPSACNDGSSAPCAPGAPAGIGPADSFLKVVVPQILATAAYSKEGLIVIVPDSPPSSPASAAAKPVGALLLSPFVHSEARVSESFNDFSLLKSISLLFGVLPLGHANDPSTVSFGATVYGASGKAANAASTAKKAAQAASAGQPRRHTASQTGG
jgi:hypothetical protein